MGTISRKNRITRRGFLELSSAALATAKLLGDVNPANAVPAVGNRVDTAKTDSAPRTSKIALEEHFVLPETDVDSSLGYTFPTPELRLQVQDLGGGRIARWTAVLWNSASSHSFHLGSRPFLASRKLSPFRGDRTTIWPSTSQSIPNAWKGSRLCRCRILRLPLRN